MGELVTGDDGMLVEDVGSWAKEKHKRLVTYIDISRGVRNKFIGPKNAGATYIDLFCGTGRARVRRTGEFIDGSCVAAWKKSVEGKAPFSKVYIADADPVRLKLAEDRLKTLSAPVVAIHGKASETVGKIANQLRLDALHFAFVDPFNIGAFEFQIMERLSKFKRMDVLVHVNKMDMQRNLHRNIMSELSAFDDFAPGWRDVVNTGQPQKGIRREVFEYWQKKVASAGFPTSSEVEMKLITGDQGQHLYWLLLAAKHELAHKFWGAAAKDNQRDLFMR